jgi:CHAT domain-containing protein
VRRLVVVSTGTMARLPVETLTADYTISYTPSMTLFAQGREKHRAFSAPSLLALGDPVFEPKRGPRLAGETFRQLPGTRLEVESIGRLIGADRTSSLLGSGANETALEELALSGKLKQFRVIHLATHGNIDLDVPQRTSLILSRDNLPDRSENEARAIKGLSLREGHLRVQTIRQSWKLDADLVVLSACQTALGKEGRGEGLLGFPQTLLSCGARTVVLSRWQVSDDSTALLMVRFYENLLGKREGLKQPLGRAASLQEAKEWLRTLTRKDAEKLVANLKQGELRGTFVTGPAAGGDKKPAIPIGERPYGHPHFWAPFILLGDPD